MPLHADWNRWRCRQWIHRNTHRRGPPSLWQLGLGVLHRGHQDQSKGQQPVLDLGLPPGGSDRRGHQHRHHLATDDLSSGRGLQTHFLTWTHRLDGHAAHECIRNRCQLGYVIRAGAWTLAWWWRWPRALAWGWGGPRALARQNQAHRGESERPQEESVGALA